MKAVVVFVVWKALYHFWLQPTQLLDRPLVLAIGQHTSAGLNALSQGNPYSWQSFARTHSLPGITDRYEGSLAEVLYEGKRVLFIVPNCNALELMVLFAGFILCYPGPWRRKAWVIPAGIVAIHIVNVLRSMALIRLSHSSYRHFFDIAHHYGFTITIYLFIFWLWMWYVNTLPPMTHSGTQLDSATV